MDAHELPSLLRGRALRPGQRCLRAGRRVTDLHACRHHDSESGRIGPVGRTSAPEGLTPSATGPHLDGSSEVAGSPPRRGVGRGQARYRVHGVGRNQTEHLQVTASHTIQVHERERRRVQYGGVSAVPEPVGSEGLDGVVGVRVRGPLEIGPGDRSDVR